MLQIIFLTAAVIGTTVMLCQFAMTLLGLGHDDAGDLAHDFHGGGHGGAGHGAGHGGAAHGTESGATEDAAAEHAAHEAGHGDFSSWLFGVLTLRTIVAALAFFGLGGYASLATGNSAAVSLVIAVAAGLAAMYAVYALLRAIYALQSEGNFRIQSSLHARGLVYIPIPGNQQGAGKVQLKVQGRLVELRAMTTAAERLPTGTEIEIVELIGPQTVLVEPIVEQRGETPLPVREGAGGGSGAGAQPK